MMAADEGEGFSKPDSIAAANRTFEHPRSDDVAQPKSQLVRYDAMCRAIDAAHEVDEVKDIRDQALALEVYARQARNVEAERKAREIRLRAERKAGELSAELEKSPGGRPAKTPGTIPGVSNPAAKAAAVTPKSQVLRNAGVSEDQARQWEKLASVPKDEFEAALADRTRKPTTAGIIKANEERKLNPVSQDALWLWGRLRDFERNGLLDKDPREVLSTLGPPMLDHVHVLAPRVAAWLKQIGKVS